MLTSHYWLSGLAGLHLARRWDVPLVHMFHTLGAIKNRVARGSGDVEPEERLAAEVRIAAEADRVVASNLVERADLAWHLGADPVRVAVIPCGVDVDLLPAPAIGPGAGAPRSRRQARALFVGRLTPIKGFETLLRALAVLRSDGLAAARLMLLVVGGAKGDTEGSEHLRQLADRLGVGHWIAFHGPQPQDVLPDYYAAADLCLMPSRYESFGMVALEAMASGVPADRLAGRRARRDRSGRADGPAGSRKATWPRSRARISGLLADEPARRALGIRAVGLGPPIRVAHHRAEPDAALRRPAADARGGGRRLRLPLRSVAPAA